MKRLMNLLRGMVVLCVTGPFPERLLNLCAQHRLDFWQLEWLDDHTVRFTARRHQLGRLEKLAERVSARSRWSSAGACPTFCCAFGPGMPFWWGWFWHWGQWRFCPASC